MSTVDLQPILPAYDSPLEAASTALVVIDMQRYFIEDDFPFGRFIREVDPEGAHYYYETVRKAVIPNILKLQFAFREAGSQIFYTEFGSNHSGGSDMPGWAQRHNKNGMALFGSPLYPQFEDPSCRLISSLLPRPGEIIIRKNTSGPLNSTNLDQIMRKLGIRTIVVTGVVTEVCVAQTAREFGDRDFDAIVATDACCSTDVVAHGSALRTIEKTFGYILPTDSIIALASEQGV